MYVMKKRNAVLLGCILALGLTAANPAAAPNEIPIAGQPEDVHEAISNYNAWLKKTPIPKLLLHANPGGMMDERAVDWCRSSLSNLTTVDLGKGPHYLQEDHPDAIGEAVASWYNAIDCVPENEDMAYAC